MSTYLDRAWPIESTSDVSMDGKAVFNLRRWRQPGTICHVRIYPADAHTFRHEVEKYGQAMKDEERARIVSLLSGPFDGTEGLDSFTLAWAIAKIEERKS